MTITVENKTKKPAQWFAILDAPVNVYLPAKGKPMAVASLKRRNLKDGTFVRMGKTPVALTMTGCNKVWPWQKNLLVWEVSLKAGETREVKWTVAKLTPEQIKAIAAMPKLKIELANEAALASQPAKWCELASPQNWQVVQRRTLDKGFVRIAGTSIHQELAIAIAGTDKDGNAVAISETIKVSPKTNGFNELVEIPAGGWYTMTVSQGGEIKKSYKPIIIEKFGVGEVFITAGQSNSTNCGQFKTKQATGMVAAFNGLAWREGNDPFWGAHDMLGKSIWVKGSSWPGFGDAVYAKYKVPVGVAVTGHGGSNTSQWQPDGPLFKHMMVRVWQLGPAGFRGILWHQGESDCRQDSTAHTYNNMVRMIRASRQGAGWDIPWFVAKVSFRPPDKISANVRAAHQKLWDNKIAQPGPDTDAKEFLGQSRDRGGRGIHFSPAGLKLLGQRWCDSVAPWLDEQLKKEKK